MRNLLLAALAIVCSLPCFAQEFELTTNGVVDSKDHTKNFIVVQIPGVSKEELFSKAHQYLTATYVSPQDVISVSGSDLIAINGFLKAPFFDAIRNCECNIRYRINLAFKEERFKIDFMIVSMNMVFNNATSTLLLQKQGLSNGLFKRDGRLTKGGELAKPYIEAVPNSIIQFMKTPKENQTTEDW